MLLRGRIFIVHKNILVLINKLLTMSTKKETKRKAFASFSLVDISSPFASVLFDELENKLILCMRTTLNYAILKEVLDAFGEVINLKTKICIYYA